MSPFLWLLNVFKNHNESQKVAKFGKMAKSGRPAVGWQNG
jgi:hypothetical protein